MIPVAILSTEVFDASEVEPQSVRFGRGGARPAHGHGHFEDLDGDGRTDRMLHFRTADSGIACGDTTVGLAAQTYSGRSLQAEDVIRTVGCASQAQVFEDVAPGHALFAYINVLVAAGVTSGCSGDPPRYCPDAVTTRGQMAVFMTRVLGVEADASGAPIFRDVRSSHPFSSSSISSPTSTPTRNAT